MTRAPLPPGPLLGFVLAVSAVAFISLLTYRALQTRSIAVQRVTHTLETVDQLQGILSLMKDAETGQRGFLLTGEEAYLEPYVNAKAQLPGVLKKAHDLLWDDPVQEQRLTGLDAMVKDKLAELEQAAVLRRKGDVAGAVALVRTDRGKVLMDRLRSVVTSMEATERAALATREEEWQRAESIASYVTFGGSALLLILIAAAAVLTSRDFKASQARAWIRSGQMAFSQRIQGEQRLDRLADRVLSFLASFLGAEVGALYVTEGAGVFRRLAGYALAPVGVPAGDVTAAAAPEPEGNVLRAGEGLLGQAAKENRPLRIENVPENYLLVTSALGRAKPRELLISPAATDGTTQAVVELGFFRPLKPEDLELMSRLSESLAVAIRASKDRTRLEELLEETQRQGEELRTQQAELEQTNTQLEEQAQLLERQRDELAGAQSVLAAKAADLQRANQYKSEFLANMSHELRTPLNSSLILAKLLAENRSGNLTAEQIKYARTISSAGNDLLAIINDILDLSKIEAGKVELSPQSVALSRVIDDLTEHFRPVAQSKGLEFTAGAAPDAPELIQTDPQRLGQILRNLVSNALKFTTTGGVWVRIVPGAAARTLRFEVQDSGIGISEPQQEIIFEAFRQADGSTHRKYGGTGLGLTISRDLARLLGGDISVESAAGKGSTFTLTLPTGVTKPAGSGLMLIVEDDTGQLENICQLLQNEAVQIIAVHTAAEALALLKQATFDCMVLDLNLPDLSGQELLKKMAEAQDLAFPSVIVYTGRSLSLEEEQELRRFSKSIIIKDARSPERLLDEVTLLLHQVEAKPPAERPVRAARDRDAALEGRRILVVEDDVRNIFALSSLLEPKGATIEIARNGREAIDTLTRSGTPGGKHLDLVLMDIMMPEMDGLTAMREIRKQPQWKKLPIIALTAKAMQDDQEKCLSAGASDYIAKPLDVEKLMSLIRVWLPK